MKPFMIVAKHQNYLIKQPGNKMRVTSAKLDAAKVTQLEKRGCAVHHRLESAKLRVSPPKKIMV
jgi:hypothetical protein